MYISSNAPLSRNNDERIRFYSIFIIIRFLSILFQCADDEVMTKKKHHAGIVTEIASNTVIEIIMTLLQLSR